MLPLSEQAVMHPKVAKSAVRFLLPELSEGGMIQLQYSETSSMNLELLCAA